jgi:hypothetical protein
MIRMEAATPSRSTAWVVVLSSLLMTSALAEEEKGTASLTGSVITVGRNHVRITLLPEMLPPSTTKASFDQTKKETNADGSEPSYAGSHVEVTWEPTLNAPLARTVVLAPGTWQLSFFSTPLQHPTDPFSDVSWSFFRANSSRSGPLAAKPEPVFCAFRRVTSATRENSPPDRCEDTSYNSPVINGWARIQIAASVDQLLSAEQLFTDFGNRGEVSTPLPSFARSFSDNAERAATELAQAVADVALERLESAALENVRRRVLKAICNRQLEQTLEQAFVSVHRTDDPIPKLLVRTCAALETIRLQELATGSGLGLQQALKQDMATLGGYLVEHIITQCLGGSTTEPPEHCPFRGKDKDKSLRAAMGGLVLLVNLAMEPEEPVTALPQAQLIVKQIVDFAKAQNVSDSPQVIQSGLVIAGAAIAFCHASGSCDSHTMRRFLDNPAQFISDGEKIKDIKKYQLLKGRLLSIVTRGVAIMSPQSRQDSRQAIIETSALLFEVLELTTEARCSRPETGCRKEIQELRETGRMVDALLRRDVPSALIAVGGMTALRLAQDNNKADLRRQTKYIGAMSGYLNSYYGRAFNGQPLGPEEQRKLRRQAINSLVDLANDRTQKYEEFTWALSITPGMRGFFARRGPSSHRNEKAWIDPGVHLSLPLGVTGEYVMSRSAGVVMNIFLLDLGQYTATQFGQKSFVKPEAWSALSPGIGIGGVYKNWTLMVDGRYTPGWRVPGRRYELQPLEDGSGERRVPSEATLNNTWTFGATLGYQVPLLRFD